MYHDAWRLPTRTQWFLCLDDECYHRARLNSTFYVHLCTEGYKRGDVVYRTRMFRPACFYRAYPESVLGIGHCPSRKMIGTSLTICTMDSNCCTKVVVHRYGGAMFVVQTILWCSIGVVYGVYLVKSGVYLTIPIINPISTLFLISHNFIIRI